jgi:hypothetical protein
MKYVIKDTNELEKLKEEFIGKKFTGFSWKGDSDEVAYVKGMDANINAIIEITSVEELHSGNYYSVYGSKSPFTSRGYYYPLEGVKNNLLVERNEEELINHVFSLIKKATV